MGDTTQHNDYVICIRNDDYPASLEVRKVYKVVPDATASAQGFVRVIDELGEDYLYPERFFAPIELPPAVVGAFEEASRSS